MLRYVVVLRMGCEVPGLQAAIHRWIWTSRTRVWETGICHYTQQRWTRWWETHKWQLKLIWTKWMTQDKPTDLTEVDKKVRETEKCKPTWPWWKEGEKPRHDSSLFNPAFSPFMIGNRVKVKVNDEEAVKAMGDCWGRSGSRKCIVGSFMASRANGEGQKREYWLNKKNS